MRVFSHSFDDGELIPEQYALGIRHPERRVHLGQNLSPHLGWEGIPFGTRSLVLICHDPDAPSRPDDVNQEGRQVPRELPRVDFYHWVVVDLSPDLKELREAEFSQGVTPHGKKGPHGPQHCRVGLNDYTGWFSGDQDMQGFYYGYDGPCPPWNDLLPHRYIFTLYATDLEQCPVSGAFTGVETLQAIQGHVLDRAQFQGWYSLHPDVAGKP